MTTPILSKITVLDMTEGVAGPYTSMLLADMGANVVKIERREGDWSRPAGTQPLSHEGNAQFIALNRNKRDLGLDVASADGRRILERLVGRADVLVSNYRAGVMARLGFGAERCRALRADLVYCTISGFGQDGPHAGLPASDTIIQAMSGVMHQVGEAGGPPLRVGFPLIDMTAANHAAQAILLALYGRLSGQRQGATIDVSLMAAALSLMSASFTRHLVSGKLPERHGNQNATLAPAGAYKGSDGRWFTIAVLRDSHWLKFCAAMGLGTLVDDARFVTNAVRVANRAALDALIVPLLAAQPAAVWLERLRAADILCGPVNTFADVMTDVALVERLPLVASLLPDVDRIMGTPARVDGAYAGTRLPPPVAGQHTRELLAEYGFAPAEIEGFLASGAAFSADTA